jgi:hypothetical protein
MGRGGSTLLLRSLSLASALSVAWSHQSWSAGVPGPPTTVTHVSLQTLEAPGATEAIFTFSANGTANLTVYEPSYMTPSELLSTIWSYVPQVGPPLAPTQSVLKVTTQPMSNSATLAALAALYNQFAALSKKLAALQPTLTSLQNQLNALPAGSLKVSTLTSQLTFLQTTLTGYQSQLVTLYGQMVALLPPGQAAGTPSATLTNPTSPRTVPALTSAASSKATPAELQASVYAALVATQNQANTLQNTLSAVQLLANEKAPRPPLSITPTGSAQSSRVPSVSGLVKDPLAFNTPAGRVSSGTEGFNLDVDLGAWFKWPQGSGLHLLGGIYFNEARLTAGSSTAPVGTAMENSVTEMIGARYDFGRNYAATVARFDQGHTQLNDPTNGGSAGFGTSAYFIDGIVGHIFTLWGSAQAGPVTGPSALMLDLLGHVGGGAQRSSSVTDTSGLLWGDDVISTTVIGASGTLYAPTIWRGAPLVPFLSLGIDHNVRFSNSVSIPPQGNLIGDTILFSDPAQTTGRIEAGIKIARINQISLTASGFVRFGEDFTSTGGRISLRMPFPGN